VLLFYIYFAVNSAGQKIDYDSWAVEKEVQSGGWES